MVMMITKHLNFGKVIFTSSFYTITESFYVLVKSNNTISTVLNASVICKSIFNALDFSSKFGLVCLSCKQQLKKSSH